MKKLKASEIRKIWLNFFASKGHSIELSSSLIPIDDPSLLWINAGVAPLKKYFDGSAKPTNPCIVNAQKCIRTNDIENVGLTARHHTFFEMLGNFSIGDYFKKEAVEYGFELLTKHFGFPLDKLYMTIYPEDTETFDLWVKLGVKKNHIIKLEGNFWEIGEGPCGPDTEIFYDRGEKYDKSNLGIKLLENDIENDRYIEIWNIVFSQYNAKNGVPRSEYKELPNKNIDTGMGLERMACVIQGVDTNYETDLFIDYIKEIERISNIKYTGQSSFKIIADHIRTLTFAISDGAVLSNEGRGYVLRRVLRRALKYAKKIGINEPFMYKMVILVVNKMKDYYPYLTDKQEIVEKIIKSEEEKFLETLSLGEKRIKEMMINKNEISGTDAFILYDTFGFPIELTMEYANEKKIKVDIEGFKEAMNIQKDKSRNARVGIQAMNIQNEDYMKFIKDSKFIGYTELKTKTKVIGVFDEGVVLKRTPFYAASGGQLADKGTINNVSIKDCIKLPNGQFLHIMNNHSFKVDDDVEVIVDKKNRDQITRNHSSAHLLHRALKEVLGPHVSQQGSQISYDTMRFDFNNYQNLTNDQIIKIEDLVNEYILGKNDVIIKEMPIEEAKKKGAEALFGEKYGNIVRVVDMSCSIELCGGTHVSNTKDIKEFAITNVESIGSGLFRITGVTGEDVLSKVNKSFKNIINEIDMLENKGLRIKEEAANSNIDLNFEYKKKRFEKGSYRIYIDYQKEIISLKEKIKKLQAAYSQKKVNITLSDLSAYDKFIKKDKLVVKTNDLSMDIIKQLADALLNKMGSGLVFIANVTDEKIIFVCKNNIGLNAGQLVKKAAIATGGNGGGRKDMATAGGKDISKLDEVLKDII